MDTLERIKDIDIRDIVELDLGRGNPPQCACPLPGHPGGAAKGRNGAFTYYPNNNSFHCFVCDVGGSVIDFWMHLHNVDARTAIRELAHLKGIPLTMTPEQEQAIVVQREREDVLAHAVDFYAKRLWDEVDGKPSRPLEYLRSRGLDDATIKGARLGFSNRKLASSVTQGNHDVEAFIKAGVLVRDGDKVRDYFSFRITFPTISRGRVMAISGRKLPDDLGGRPDDKKYLNLKGVPLKHLFYEDNIRHEAFVCEGLPDTLTLVMMGLPACGQQGTSGMEQHAHKFAKCKRVWCCFDTDGAGQEGGRKAAIAIHMAMASGTVRMLQLPAGTKDINEWAMAGHGQVSFMELAAQAPTLIDYLLKRLPSDMEERSSALGEILRLVAHVSADQQDIYLESIRKETKLTKATLTSMLKAALRGEEAKPEENTVKFKFEDRRMIVPVQDFAFNSPAKGNYATFVRCEMKEVLADGTAVPVERYEPVLVSITHEVDTKPTIGLTAISKLQLTQAEQRRIPSEEIIRGRWRTAGKNAFGVERFTKGEVATVSGMAIFQDIVNLIGEFIWFPTAGDSRVIALYVMATYIYRLFPAFGYLHLHGIRESGKSNVGRIITDLAFNAVKATSISPSALFRLVEGNCCTLVIDEAEKLNNPKDDVAAQSIILLSNDGYKRGGRAILSEMNKRTNKYEPAVYDAYCPKVYASIKDLNHVLRSRCIKIRCLRALPSDLKGASIKDMAQNERRMNALFEDLRDRLHCWGLLTFHHHDEMFSKVLEGGLEHLRGREREIWMPIITVAAVLDNELAGGDAAKMEILAQDGRLITPGIIEEQRNKEAEHRVEETDESEELGILKAAYEVITTGETMDVSGAAWTTKSTGKGTYLIKELYEKVNKVLLETGTVQTEFGMSAKRITSTLIKTFAVDPKDRRVVWMMGRTHRTVSIDPLHMRSIIERLGGVMDDAS